MLVSSESLCRTRSDSRVFAARVAHIGHLLMGGSSDRGGLCTCYARTPPERSADDKFCEGCGEVCSDKFKACFSWQTFTDSLSPTIHHFFHSQNFKFHHQELLGLLSRTWMRGAMSALQDCTWDGESHRTVTQVRLPPSCSRSIRIWATFARQHSGCA